MKKLMLTALTVAAAATIFAAEATAPATGKKPSKRELRERRIAAAGGLVVRPYAGKMIMIVNDQQRIAEKDFFKDKANSITGLFNYPVKVVPPKTDVSDAGLVITLSDNNQAPALLVAPEVPWAGVNVGALAADNPKPETLVSRLQKEIWRAFLYAGGAANSVMQPCILRPVRLPRDLDAYPNLVPCPEALPRVANTAKALGIGESASCTYKQACMEGWAPAPTNDVQKAIAEQVKAEKERGPANPIEIPSPKKK